MENKLITPRQRSGQLKQILRQISLLKDFVVTLPENARKARVKLDIEALEKKRKAFNHALRQRSKKRCNAGKISDK